MLSGFVTNDLLIDFEGQLFGQQMVVELTSGTIYQDALGGDGPPNPAFFPFAPSLEFDTYVTIGGRAPGEPLDQLILGSSTELGKPGPKQFDVDGINIAWAPAPGVVVEDRTNFMVARLTLSDDAQGVVYYFGNADGQGVVVEPAGVIVDGRMSPLPGPHDCVPEPASAALAGFATLAAGWGRRS